MNRLKQLREQHGMKQSELGKLLNVKDAAISKYESEKIPLTGETLLSLSKIFNVSIDYILGCEKEIENDVSEIEWRYPPVSNRLGNILREYRQKKDLSLEEFAERLDISSDLYTGIETGRYDPTLELLQKIADETEYNTDYLTGASDLISIATGETIDFQGVKASIYEFEGNLHFKTRFEELCLKHSISNNNTESKLGLDESTFNDIKYNRMPTLSELLKISYAFGVSMDYLIGKTDTRLSSLNKVELDLILNYRQCLDCFKENISQRASELCIESLHEREQEESVAADEQPLKKASGK